MRVLIAYATRHGATAGIAERIAERLRAGGVDADARPAKEVRDAAAYMFHWLGDATAFVDHHRELLAGAPTWLFSSGPIGTDLVDKNGRDVFETSIPKEFSRLRSSVRPRGEKIFFGALDPDAKPVGVAERFMHLFPAGRDALPKGDFRDWPAIDAWADEIAASLREPVGIA